MLSAWELKGSKEGEGKGLDSHLNAVYQIRRVPYIPELGQSHQLILPERPVSGAVVDTLIDNFRHSRLNVSTFSLECRKLSSTTLTTFDTLD